MPGKVLKDHGAVSKENNDDFLNISDLTEQQRSKLISLCEIKIKEYIESRGGERAIWLHRMKPFICSWNRKIRSIEKSQGQMPIMWYSGEYQVFAY